MRDVEIKRRGNSLKIGVDNSYITVNPRVGNNLGHLICWHGRYYLGDKHNFIDRKFFEEYVSDKDNEVYCILKVYLYDHSGLALSTTPFNDKFDSRQVGYIYCTKQDLKDLEFPQDDYEKVETELKNEITTYNDYLNNDIDYYYYEITDEDDNLVDKMTGFVNDNKIKMFKEMQQFADSQYHYLFNELIRIEKKRESCL